MKGQTCLYEKITSSQFFSYLNLKTMFLTQKSVYQLSPFKNFSLKKLLSIASKTDKIDDQYLERGLKEKLVLSIENSFLTFIQK